MNELNGAFASRTPLVLCHADTVCSRRLPKGGNLWAPSSDLCTGIFTLLPQVNSANHPASTITFSILDTGRPDSSLWNTNHRLLPSTGLVT